LHQFDFVVTFVNLLIPVCLSLFACHRSFLHHSVSYALMEKGQKVKAKLGHRVVSVMQPNSVVWDTEVRGFCARRQFSDVVTYSVVFRTNDNIQRWYKLGRTPIFTPDLARKEAIRVLRDVALGKDPSAERHESRHGMTVAQLCDEYEADMNSGKINGKKASTIMSDVSRIKNHIKPKLGRYKVSAITSDQIEAFMNEQSKGSAKRVIGLVGAIFSFAVKRKWRADNPVSTIEKPQDVKRMRRLAETEYAQLWSAVNGIKKGVLADVFTMLAITGFRSGEIKNLRWSEIDFERGIATLGETKTGLSVRPLSRAAIEIINRQPQTSTFVFTYKNGKPVPSLTPHWTPLGMSTDVTPHVLRHSFASLAADLGLGDSTIAGLLGHSRKSITSRYIHLDKALIAAADLVAGETMRLMQG
jgi:site-specific recombinase XerD